MFLFNLAGCFVEIAGDALVRVPGGSAFVGMCNGSLEWMCFLCPTSLWEYVQKHIIRDVGRIG